MKNKYELKITDLKIGLNILKKDVIVYKKLRDSVAQLYLPKGTKVVKTADSSGKLRCNEAIVLLIIPIGRWTKKYSNLTVKKDYNKFFSYGHVLYSIGKKVKPTNGFNDYDFTDCCKAGIHFFCNEKRAKKY